MGLNLAQALRLQPPGPTRDAASVVAFVGAGGKTTAMFQLARQLPPPVMVTTTTHLGTWQASLADLHKVCVEAERPTQIPAPGVTLFTGPATADGRLTPPPPATLIGLHELAQAKGIPLLIEADGAHGRPLKAPAAHEPNMPGFARLVMVVAGLSGLGKPLSEEFVHRPEQFAAVSGLRPGEPVTAEGLVRVLCNAQEGGLKSVPPHARRVALLTQADSEALQAQAQGMARDLLKSYDSVVIADLGAPAIHAVREHVAGIVLAAGGSSRMGRSKVLLDWRGEPFVRVVAATALAAGLSPVVVVTGSSSDVVGKAIEGLPVVVAHNERWQSGQSTSIQAGLRALPDQTGAAVFLLADQPQIHFDVITALVDAHAARLSPIVAPLVLEERRANPVLFDRVTFPDLLALQGDVGGRAVFSGHHVEYLPWHDDRLLLDVDTEADYRRLVEDDTL